MTKKPNGNGIEEASRWLRGRLDASHRDAPWLEQVQSLLAKTEYQPLARQHENLVRACQIMLDAKVRQSWKVRALLVKSIIAVAEDRIADSIHAATFDEFGEHELAERWRNNPDSVHALTEYSGHGNNV